MASARMTATTAPNTLPLEHGDRLTASDFRQRHANMPHLKKAELLEGMVYVPANYRGRILDRAIPPLENGDHLSRAEFERRWENMPDLKKAELLNGVVYMTPAVSADFHGIPHARLMFRLGQYWAATSGVFVTDNSTLRIPRENETQPDAMLLIEAGCGGSAAFDTDGCVRGVPELVAEISASSASYDLNTKLELYQGAGIPEYIACRTRDDAASWFILRNGKYQPLLPGPDGIFRSEVFPGLWLDAAALMRGDLVTVSQVVQQGIACPEHALFVTKLQKLTPPV